MDDIHRFAVELNALELTISAIVVIFSIVANFVLYLKKHIAKEPLKDGELYNSNAARDEDADNLHIKCSPQQIELLASHVSNIKERLINTQYVLKDKKAYSNVFQSPLRDSLRELDALSLSLESLATISQAPTQKNADSSGSLFHAVQNRTVQNSVVQVSRKRCINSSQVISDTLPVLMDFARQQNKIIHLYELSHGQMSLPLGLLDKLLRELILNAIKHNPEETVIEVKCSVENTHVHFEVSDTGVGIPMQHVPQSNRLMENRLSLMSRRISDAQTQINLHAVSQLADAHGGCLSIYSRLNKGTKISLKFPAQLIKANPYPLFIKRRPVTGLTKERRTQRKKVLFVSRFDHVSSSLSQYLQERYALITCRSFDIALKQLFENKLDMVIADFSWQDALSLQLAQFMREHRALAKTPIIMITAFSNSTIRAKAYAKGVNAVVEKPLDLHELSKVIENLLRNFSHVKQINSHNGQASQDLTNDESVAEGNKEYTVLTHQHQANLSEQDKFKAQIQSLVESCFEDESFTQQIAADRLFISSKTLQRRMIKYIGDNFNTYLRRYRLDRAQNLLHNGASVTEVTYSVGFSSVSYFSQCFKQEFGYPPSELNKAS
uniref:helix-turn-helix domain-containing protein n=1 Tax=Ningiella ruwaisensis TaxID=2364274 RepID=UPI00109EEAD7|nr:helix-turn-helix domain-containing protein [Ningiella ruwaisensis]